jgi:hypothetical protein
MEVWEVCNACAHKRVEGTEDCTNTEQQKNTGAYRTAHEYLAYIKQIVIYFKVELQ